MALWSYAEEQEGDSARTDVRSGQQLTSQWELATDTPGLKSAHAVAALALLAGVAKGAAHPDYPYARCTDLSADRHPDDPYRFAVRATFLEPAPQPGQPLNPAGGQPSPPDRAPQWSGSFRRLDRYRPTDRSGALIANSAGDRFDDPPPVPETGATFSVKRWYDALSYVQLKGYFGRTNNAEWYGFPKHSLRIAGANWRYVTDRGWTGFEVDWQVEHEELPTGPNQVATGQTGAFRPTPVLDVGWNVVRPVAGGFQKVPAKSVFGENLAAPVKLNLFGEALPEGADPKYKFFVLCDEISFALLG